MKKPAVVAAMVVMVASLATCVIVAKSAGTAVRPVVVPEFGPMLERAAEAAQGLRVLAIVAKPGAAPTGAIYESSRGPEGWRPYPATPAPDDPLAPGLLRLAAHAAVDYAEDRRFEEATAKALAVFGVAVVAATDGSNAIPPDVRERDEAVVAVGFVPGLRLRHAQPVFHHLAEEPSISADDALGFRRAWRGGDASFLDFEDHAPWGGDVTIESAGDAEYLLPWSAAGAKVEIDGAPAQFRAARVPVLLVKVPAGSHRLSVRYGDDALLPQWIVIVAAAAFFGAFIALWLGLRPRAEDVKA